MLAAIYSGGEKGNWKVTDNIEVVGFPKVNPINPPPLLKWVNGLAN